MLILTSLLLAAGLHAQDRPGGQANKQVLADFLIEWMQVRYPAAPSEGVVLYVSARHQRMYLVVDGAMTAEFAISTARNGLGALRGSQQTPEGLHRVARKFGDDVSPLGILKYRQYTGAVAKANQGQGDLITSRILWLDGLDPERMPVAMWTAMSAASTSTEPPRRPPSEHPAPTAASACATRM